MTETHSVDDLLVKVQHEQSNIQAPVQPIPEVSSPDQLASQAVDDATAENIVEETPEKVEEKAEKPQVEEEKPQVSAESPIDEYGNPVEKPKMYSEEEVQRMIRDRLSRGKHADQPNSQQAQEAAKNFQADPNSEESWEQQLEAFVDKAMDKRQEKLSKQQWQAQEAQKQADFESKFTAGMSKYQDFHQVLAGKPITNEIMMATRGLDNPAAFIYGAAKLHPQELTRIANIPDAYQQAAEIGRLHERMIKARVSTSKASKPLEAPKGDMPSAKNDRISIDEQIRRHERQKFTKKR